MKFGSPAITFVYHLGVHCTDENRLIQSLMRNGDDLQKQKIIVPRVKRYRKLLGEVTKKYRGEPMAEDEQKELFETLMRDYPAERVIFSHENFLCMPGKAFEGGRLYGKASFRSIWLRYLFPENPCEFFLAIRNPATYIPAALRQDGMPGYEKFVKGTNLRNLRWRQVVEDIQENNPGCPVTVWCNEDTPLIWPAILREISDADPDYEFAGELDMLRAIMREDGFERMLSYLKTHKPQNEIQRRRVFAAFLDKFASEGALEEDIDLPGWTPDLVEEITSVYEDDVYQIERMSGVTFIAT